MKAPTAVHTPGTATVSSSNAAVGAVADMESTNTTTVTGNLNNGNKNKNSSPSTNISSWQQEMLMERLRTKCPILRPLQDSTKALRNCILNKQHLMDSTDRNMLSSCLDNLQQNIPVTSLDAMIERLEATACQLGLNFTSSPSAVYEVYVSCDMFYVEVLLERDGTTRDVKVEFGGESTTSTDNVELSQSCPELIDCLSRCDFKQFTAHLEGFLAMYTLNTEDKKAKLRTQYALKALETDLTKLFELAQETISDTYKLVLKSPVGLLFPRRGGQSMRLVYFISPYELLDVGTGLAVPLTPATALNKEFSHNVQLRITATTALHKLQLTTLMQVTKAADGNKLPSFSGLTASNSITIPSVFTLKLANPLPLSLTLALRIADVTGIPLKDVTGADVNETAATATGTSYSQLMDLIVHQAAQGQLSGSTSDKGLFVTLPDQQHCYFMPTQGCDFPGMLVSSIPFSHPTHITSVLMLLRAQAAFNTLVSSCVRPNSKQDMESAYMFEVTSLSHEYISVTFEHPLDESTATAELDLSDLCNVRCRLHTLPQDASVTFCSDEYATKVLQRCMSIPVTMRALMRKVIREDMNDALSQGDSVVMSNASSDLNQNTSKFLLSDYERLGPATAGRRDHLPGGGGGAGGIGAGLSGTVGGGTPTAVTSASGSNTFAAASSVAGACVVTAAGGGGRSPSLTVAHGVGNASPGIVGPSNNQQQASSSFFSNAAFAQIKTEPGIDASAYAGGAAVNQKMSLPIQQQPYQQHFLEEAKTVKVRKRKVMEIDRKGGGGSSSTSNNSPYSDDIIEVEDPLKDPLDISDTKRDVERLLTYDSLESSRRRMDKPPPSYEASTEAKHRREAKMEKLQSFLAKRRASNDFLATTTTSSSVSSSDASSCDLAALREKVYGAGSAATFAQFNLVPSDDNITADGRDITKKSKKARTTTASDHSSSDAIRKSPIVLDLTESETPTSSSSKKSSSSSSSSSRSSGCSSLNSGGSSSIASSLNASVLLKRPGIEIFPIAGGNAPISIPSSITVTPVIKSSSSSSLSYSSEDKYKDRKERKDKKESSRDKKRRREDSPSSISSSSKSKVHIISSSLKHSSSMPSMDKLKSESSKSGSSSSSSSSISGLTIKPSTPPYQSPSKSSSSNRPPSSPNLSKSSSLHSKLSYSPTNKTSSSNSSVSKGIYSPSQSQHSSSSSPKGTSSPKLSSSPKYSGLSPKHTSSGKPSINALKSSAPSLSSFSKTSLSPKLSSSTSKSSSGNSSGSTTNSHQYTSSRDKMSSSLPARAQSNSGSSSLGSSFSLGSSLSTSSSSKSKVSSSTGSSSGSSSEKTKSTNSSSSDGLSISKVSQSGGESNASLNPFFSVGNTTIASALQDKSSFLLDKGKASPPKNRKGSCLSDIVDKLRAGVSGSSDSVCLVEPSDKKDVTKVGGITDLKKDPDKKTDYTIKPLDGLKLSINKSKSKELKENFGKSSSNCNSLSPTPKSSKSSSGLEPGVLSGPASKKVSMSSLPPIPKLSSASVNTASVSPLSSGQLSYSSSTSSSYNSTSLTGSSSHSGYSSSSSSYQKERSKDKTSSSSNSSSVEKSKGKETSNTSSSSSKSSSSEVKKEPSLNIPEKHFSSGSGNSGSSSIISSSTLSNSSNSKNREESRSSGGSTQSSSSSGFNRKQASGDGESRSNKSSSSSHQRILSSDKTEKAQSNDSLPNKVTSDSKGYSYAMKPPSSVQAPSQYHGKRVGDGSSSAAGGPDLGHKHNKPPSEGCKETKFSGDGSSAIGNSSSQSGLKNHTVVPSCLKSSSVSNEFRTTATSLTTTSISKESHGNTSRKSDVFRLSGTDYNHVSSNLAVPVTNSNASSKASLVSSRATNSCNLQGSVTSASDPVTASSTSSAGKAQSLTTSGSCKIAAGDGVISPVTSNQMPSCVSLPPPPAPPPVSAPSLPSTGYGHPLSPSVSIKIVKSPAPVSSPLSMISPLSVSSQHSPCIIDDDLMDEALMGPRK